MRGSYINGMSSIILLDLYINVKHALTQFLVLCDWDRSGLDE
jgi:hypothetical protein